ncbi:hypothetical protein Phi14:2_gp093 [Cellulophaga phage phi14:2]|uniref:Uncharacterized protein n=1 Tax=Cellulophaga phage phi14:2 TaxID=1327990 RepID=S0A0S7_9CAUD|nr:hypothetical protein Phi14:2_gp093 [Cellulophaga phage phi14:2]
MAIFNIISEELVEEIIPFTTSNNIIRLGNINLKVSQFEYNTLDQ